VVTRRAWFLGGVRALALGLAMIPSGLLLLLIMTPAMFALAIALIARMVGGWLVALVSPTLGARIMPDESFGDAELDRIMDWLDRPLGWLERLAPAPLIRPGRYRASSRSSKGR
jgi:hypothetical protein